ncbi:protein SDA1 [Histomonas meleagridis]|uniref:protein SDA1-like n=1 Tax=Histomonas meleagridis TaxID=135588 RepID=UPI00355A4545|nr:protein SDA1 [Histomonas meleagridis]KAH0802369.1 protein SDA1-like [Histomonas meleagridis]
MQDFVFIDPQNHVEEIRQAYDEFSSLLALYVDQPKEINKRFIKLLYDLSHIIHYHSFASEFAQKLCDFVSTHTESIPHDVRIQLVQAITVLHNKGVIGTIKCFNVLIPLFKINDKIVRRSIYGHFFLKIPFHQTNQTKHELQKFVSTEYDGRIAFKVLQLIVDIFHKENVEDLKTINFIARCLNSSDPRITNTVVSFFLDPYIPQTKPEVDIDEERRKAELKLKVSRKTNSRTNKLEKVKKMRQPIPSNPVQVISFIDDPHKFSIILFRLLSAPSNGKVFKSRESQLRALSLLSKVINTFQLDFDQYYNWVQRFLRPSYDEITRLLAIVASSVHQLTNPDTLTDLIRYLANQFVADHLDEEIIVVGLNTIREICARNPHGMTETLISDLAMYKKSNVKGVVMAARSLIQLYREVMPDILPKRERGKPNETETKEALPYGATVVHTGIKGAEGIDMERPITQEEFEQLKKGRELEGDEEKEEGVLEDVDEEQLLEGSKVHKTSKEEKIEIANEGKPEKHVFHSRMEEKTAGFSNKEKLKNKPFRLTRFRKDSNHMQLRSLSAIQKIQKKRETIQRTMYAR